MELKFEYSSVPGFVGNYLKVVDGKPGPLVGYLMSTHHRDLPLQVFPCDAEGVAHGMQYVKTKQEALEYLLTYYAAQR